MFVALFKYAIEAQASKDLLRQEPKGNDDDECLYASWNFFSWTCWKLNQSRCQKERETEREKAERKDRVIKWALEVMSSYNEMASLAANSQSVS